MAAKKKRDDAPRYRKLYPLFWRDRRVCSLPIDAKLIAAHCLTSHQSNRCGLFAFSTAMAAEELSIKHGGYLTHFRQVCDTLKWKYDDDARCLYIPTWWKWNPPENESHLKGCLRDLSEITESFLMIEFARNLAHLPDTLHDTFMDTMRTRLSHLSDTLPTPDPLGDRHQESRKAGKQDIDSSNEESSGETPLASSPATAVLLTFPTDGSPSSWSLTQEQLDLWKLAYPTLDLLAEARKAFAWIDAKRERRKTAGGMKKFLVGWFGKAIDYRRDSSPNVRPAASDRMSDAEFLGTNQ